MTGDTQSAGLTAQHSRRLLWVALAVSAAGLLVAHSLRLTLLDSFPLRDDEALYSTWALAAQQDPLFLRTFPDKPPVFLWLQAVAIYLFGATAAGARLLSIGASTLTVALVLPVARHVWPSAGPSTLTGVVALWLVALSPFAISFAATAYTDSLLVLWLMLALALGLRGRWLGAGAALAAAIFTKQQGVLFVPLILLLPLALAEKDGTTIRRQWVHLLTGIALVAVPLLAWDASRWATAPSPWDLGMRHYGTLALAAPGQWLARALAWGEPLSAFAAAPLAWLLIGGALAGGLLLVVRRRYRVARLLYGWSAGFLLVHLLSTVQTWDRYLLPLAPLIAVLAAGPVAAAFHWLQSRGAVWSAAGLLVLLLVLIPPAQRAARGGLPVGGDHGALAGLTEVAAQLGSLSADAAAAGEPAPVVYQQRLGWQLGYLLAAEQRSGEIVVRWFSSPVALADDAATNPHRIRLVLDPAWSPAPGLAQALAARGLVHVRLQQAGNVSLHQIRETESATRTCTWCLCRSGATWPSIYVDSPAWSSAGGSS